MKPVYVGGKIDDVARVGGRRMVDREKAVLIAAKDDTLHFHELDSEIVAKVVAICRVRFTIERLSQAANR